MLQLLQQTQEARFATYPVESNLPAIPDSTPSTAGFSLTSTPPAFTAPPTPLSQSFAPAITRYPVLPAQSPVIISPTMPQGTPLSMPSVVGTATTYLPPNNGGLQPSDLLHPLPSIVNTAPVVVPPACGNSIERWVNDNPMLALLGLGAAAYFLLRNKR